METNRLILRERTKEQIEKIRKQSQEDQLLFFGLESIQELENSLVRTEKRFSNKSIGFKLFDLIKKSTNEVIGSCGYHTWVKDHARAEIGYRLFDKFQSQGFMSEALEAILRIGFSSMNLNRIEACISPDNQKSIKLVERFGFVKEGLMRKHYFQNNQFYDSVIFSLLSSEFK